MALSDVQLMEEWAYTGDVDAFSEIVARHSAMAFATCLRIVQNAGQAERTALECFAELAESTSPPKEPPGTWLHGEATRRSIQRIPPSQRRSRARSSAETISEQVAQWIDEAIASLPEKRRTPIVYHYLEGRSLEVVARTIDKPRTTVQSLVDKGVAGIRKYLAGQGVSVSSRELATLMAENVALAVPTSLASELAELPLSEAAQSLPRAGRRPAQRASGGKAPWLLAGGCVVLCVIAAVVLLTRGEVPEEKVEPPVETAEAQEETPEPAVSATKPSESAAPRRPAPGSPRTKADQAVSPAQQTLKGVVRDAGGNPIEWARIYVGAVPAENLREEEAIARTGADGSFTVAKLPAGETTVSAWHPDFFPGSAKAMAGKPVDIVLESGTAIEGVVMLAGEPVSSQGVGYRLEGGATKSALTDEEGKYAFPGLAPGYAKVYAELRTPGGLPRRMEATAQVAEDSVTEVNFDFPAVDASIEGVVTFNDEAKRGAEVSAWVHSGEETEEVFRTHTDGEGVYHLEVPAGNALVCADVRVGRHGAFGMDHRTDAVWPGGSLGLRRAGPGHGLRSCIGC